MDNLADAAYQLLFDKMCFLKLFLFPESCFFHFLATVIFTEKGKLPPLPISRTTCTQLYDIATKWLSLFSCQAIRDLSSFLPSHIMLKLA